VKKEIIEGQISIFDTEINLAVCSCGCIPNVIKAEQIGVIHECGYRVVCRCGLSTNAWTHMDLAIKQWNQEGGFRLPVFSNGLGVYEQLYFPSKESGVVVTI
jgi:hypothetical protein